MTSFNHTTYPAARKPHLCDECGRQIGVGERYARTAAVWEGEFFTNVACSHCAIARFIVDYQDAWYHEGFYHGLREWLSENGWEVGVWAARLLVGVRRRWQRFDGAGLMSLPTNPWPDAAHLTASIAAVTGKAVAA